MSASRSSCVDRLYLNAYVPNLQVGPGADLLRDHLGMPDPVAGGDREDR